MKKYFDLATVTALVLAVSGFARHYQLNREIGDLLKSIAVKIAPWVDTIIYS